MFAITGKCCQSVFLQTDSSSFTAPLTRLRSRGCVPSSRPALTRQFGRWPLTLFGPGWQALLHLWWTRLTPPLDLPAASAGFGRPHHDIRSPCASCHITCRALCSWVFRTRLSRRTARKMASGTGQSFSSSSEEAALNMNIGGYRHYRHHTCCCI